MGRDYDAAVMGGGLCGFMLGTTANAMANMEALVDRYGPAPRAFLVVPMVGAFFIDFVNALIITGLPEPMDLNRDDAWALLTEYTKGESLLKHALARRSRGARLRARRSARTRTAGASSRCSTTSTTSAGRRSATIRYKGAEILREQGLSRVGDPRDPVARDEYHRRDARQPAREDAVRLRRAGRLHHRARRWCGRARASSISRRAR